MPAVSRRLFLAALLLAPLCSAPARADLPQDLVGVYLGEYAEKGTDKEGTLDIGIEQVIATNVATLWTIKGRASFDKRKAFKVEGTYHTDTGLLLLTGISGKGKKKIGVRIECKAFKPEALLDGAYEIRKKKIGGALLSQGYFESTRLD